MGVARWVPKEALIGCYHTVRAQRFPPFTPARALSEVVLQGDRAGVEIRRQPDEGSILEQEVDERACAPAIVALAQLIGQPGQLMKESSVGGVDVAQRVIQRSCGRLSGVRNPAGMELQKIPTKNLGCGCVWVLVGGVHHRGPP